MGSNEQGRYAQPKLNRYNKQIIHSNCLIFVIAKMQHFYFLRFCITYRCSFFFNFLFLFKWKTINTWLFYVGFWVLVSVSTDSIRWKDFVFLNYFHSTWQSDYATSIIEHYLTFGLSIVHQSWNCKHFGFKTTRNE